MTHASVCNLTIIGSDKFLSPGRHQAIILTNAGILLIGPLEQSFSKMLIGIHTFSFKKMHLKITSAKWQPFCPGLNMSMKWPIPYAVNCTGPVLAKSTWWNTCICISIFCYDKIQHIPGMVSKMKPVSFSGTNYIQCIYITRHKCLLII